MTEAVILRVARRIRPHPHQGLAFVDLVGQTNLRQ
jgi:hypothetical protein